MDTAADSRLGRWEQALTSSAVDNNSDLRISDSSLDVQFMPAKSYNRMRGRIETESSCANLYQ